MRKFGLARSTTSLTQCGILHNERDTVTRNFYPNSMERAESSSILFEKNSYNREAYVARTSGCYVLFRWTNQCEVEVL